MSKKGKGMGKFITGAFVGASLGVLFAPKKGSETRKELKEKAGELASSIKNLDKEEIKQKLNAKIKELKNDLESLNKETVVELMKEKATSLVKKADELIDVAKEKSAPVIEKAAKEVKDKTVIVLKSAIEKLEGQDKKENNSVKNEPKLAQNNTKKNNSSKSGKKKIA